MRRDTFTALIMTEPLPTRESLLDALKADLESFVYLSEQLSVSHCTGPVRDCVEDAIARINDMLNLANASGCEGSTNDYNRGVIDGPKEVLRLTGTDDEIIYVTGKLMDKIRRVSPSDT